MQTPKVGKKEGRMKEREIQNEEERDERKRGRESSKCKRVKWVNRLFVGT